MRRLVALSLVPLLAACGSDDKPTGPASGRVIQVRTSDALRFDPSTVTAKPGEKVTFEITNPGQLNHEFTIGDAAFQDSHVPSGGSGHGGHTSGQGASMDVKAGRTVRLEFTMPADTAPTYACHVNQHDKAGMRGMVTYTG